MKPPVSQTVTSKVISITDNEGNIKEQIVFIDDKNNVIKDK